MDAQDLNARVGYDGALLVGDTAGDGGVRNGLRAQQWRFHHADHQKKRIEAAEAALVVPADISASPLLNVLAAAWLRSRDYIPNRQFANVKIGFLCAQRPGSGSRDRLNLTDDRERSAREIAGRRVQNVKRSEVAIDLE